MTKEMRPAHRVDVLTLYRPLRMQIHMPLARLASIAPNSKTKRLLHGQLPRIGERSPNAPF